MQRVRIASGASTQSGGAFHQAVYEVSHADPLVFLDALEGEPRGFWGRQDRWVAWGGALARIDVSEGSSRSRFTEVRDEARRVLRRIYADWGSMPFRERPRFFGGFSFLESGCLDPAWKGYPPAGFILPRVILEARDGDVRLRVGSLFPARMGGPDAESRALAERLLEVVSDPDRARTRHAPAAGDDERAPAPTPDVERTEVDPDARQQWEDGVRTLLEAIEEGRIHKAVLARALDVSFDHPVDPVDSLAFLRAENRRAHVYFIETHAGRVFLGAAPEVLAELRRGRFQATAVAGSMPRGSTDEEDARFAGALLASEKDRMEHRLTTEEMADVLGSRLADLDVEEEPRVLAMPLIQHLETVLRGTVGPVSGEDILSLVEALHPTPAVCGRPRAEAETLIRATEPFDRGWYSGPVGWFDPSGDGDFVPALRGAIGSGSRWRLFAGAGIVAGSDPQAEWEETALKFEPALRALRSGAGEVP